MNFLVLVKIAKKEGETSLIINESVKSGTPIWLNTTPYHELGTARVTFDELKKWPEEKQAKFKKHCWAVNWDTFVGCVSGETSGDLTNYINHSCDPSAWFSGDDMIVARRDLRAGDEITIEYATVDHMYVEFDGECQCGSTNCRQKIRNTDYQLPEIRKKYMGHMMTYLQNWTAETDFESDPDSSSDTNTNTKIFQ